MRLYHPNLPGQEIDVAEPVSPQYDLAGWRPVEPVKGDSSADKPPRTRHSRASKNNPKE